MLRVRTMTCRSFWRRSCVMAAVVAILCIFVHVGKASNMIDVLHITITGSERPNLLLGPVEAIVTVKNISTQRVEIHLPYPNPNHLRFECKAPGFAVPKPVDEEVIQRTIPIAVDPGDNYRAVYYLNRYLSFLKEGKAPISYHLSMLVTRAADTPEAVHDQQEFKGTFTVLLIEASEQALRNELARYAGQLESRNRQEKMQAAEALAFLDTPHCVEYVAHMLAIDNLEVIGIRSLGRLPFPEDGGTDHRNAHAPGFDGGWHGAQRDRPAENLPTAAEGARTAHLKQPECPLVGCQLAGGASGPSGPAPARPRAS